MFDSGRTRAAKGRQIKSLVPAQQITKEGTHSYVLLESPFTLVSKINKGPPLSSLPEHNPARR